MLLYGSCGIIKYITTHGMSLICLIDLLVFSICFWYFKSQNKTIENEKKSINLHFINTPLKSDDKL
jgi:hypothetical protein